MCKGSDDVERGVETGWDGERQSRDEGRERRRRGLVQRAAQKSAGNTAAKCKGLTLGLYSHPRRDVWHAPKPS